MSFLHLGIVNTGLKDYVGADLAFDQAEALYPDYVDEDGGTGAYRFNAWLDAYNDATSGSTSRMPRERWSSFAWRTCCMAIASKLT